MTPGTHNITVYRGAKFSETLELTDTATGMPYDLTDMGPFYAQARVGSGGPVMVDFTVTVSEDPKDGLLTVEADADEDLPEREAQWGILDSDKQLWIIGRAKLTTKIPEIPEP